MDDEKYKKFFQEVKEFLAEQKLQRLRGLNEYNLLQAVRDPNEEVGLHSRFLYSFLDTNGAHYQDDLFVKIFVETVLGIKNFGKVVRVEKEVLTDTNRRIDFVIESEKYLIGIEMKIDASDQEHQIYDYYTYLEKIKSHEQNIIIYYLTKHGNVASNTSYKRDDSEVKYERISFEKNILEWIKVCQEQIENITNLNYALEEYKEIVEIITEQKKEKVMSLADKILEKENEDWLKVAEKIYQAYPKIMEIKTKKILDGIQKLYENSEFFDNKALDITIDNYKIRIFKINFSDSGFKIQTIRDDKYEKTKNIENISNIQDEIDKYLCPTK